jgi:hypothetical protein
MTRDNNNDELAVLMGNGVSIAANQDLFIPNLTKEIRERFEQVDSKQEAPDRVLARLARRGKETGDPYKDFEAMIGPLDQQSDNLHDLRELAELVGKESKAVRNAIQTIDTFVMGLRRLGVGHALDIIAAKSVAHFDQRLVVEEFLSSAVASASGKITVGNLNYDSLGMAGLLNVAGAEMCDMVFGYKPREFDILGDGTSIVGARMRTAIGDFPLDRRIRLVHPHGSLTWLRNPDTGRVYRFDIGDLRMLEYWAAWRDGKTEWEPQVVLTNQSAKSDVVARAPFKLAYDVLHDRLVKADRWLIAGYSFRDECVNDLLASAWDSRKDVPEVMVVTYGDGLTEEDVIDGVGYNAFTDPLPNVFLHICRCGVALAPACSTWADWSDDAGSMTA